MAERIEYPPELTGTEEEQIRTIYRYLRRTVEKLNGNQEITDENLSGYISAQTNALRNLSGETTQPQESRDVRSLSEELVATMQSILTEVQGVAKNTVTRNAFTNLWIDRARTAYVSPAGGGASFIIANAIKTLQQTADQQDDAIGKLEDGTAGYVYSGELGRDGNNQPIYGTAIGPDVISWDSYGNPQYNESNALAVFSTESRKIRSGQNLRSIATENQLDGKEDKYAETTTETDADQFDASMTGKWDITVSGLQNFPAGLPSGEHILMEVESGSGFVLQRIFTSNGYIYTRIGQGQSWGGWYKFTGIAAAT